MRLDKIALALLVATSVALSSAAPAAAVVPAGPPPKTAEAVGGGGAVASVDPDATAVGIDVLRRGGNAVDAAVAVAAALGVTEPYSSGFGGGGFFVYYDPTRRTVHTIDGRETAPATATPDYFLENGVPLPFDQAVTSGLSVGVPGTPALWERAVRRWGTRPLSAMLEPAARLAERGFVVDETFAQQTADNVARFSAFPATRDLFLPDGAPPAVGSVLRNPDLAATYREVARSGVRALYHGPIGADVVATVSAPPVDPAAGRTVRPGRLTAADLAAYRVVDRDPTRVEYRGLDVYGMAPPSSGGTTVGEALNILEVTDLGALDSTRYLHRFIEASRLSFADRNRYVGDPAFSDVPTEQLLSQDFADSRACLIDPTRAGSSPVAPGDPRSPVPCGTTAAGGAQDNGGSTTHLTVADRWGGVVSYTLTIEETGGSGIVVPGRGFLLNNELTDFSFGPPAAGQDDPNLPGPRKRPRSSMNPTIVLRSGEPFLAVGSPGGPTIITTTLQVLLGRIDRGLPLVDAIAAPRVSQRNSAGTEAEPALLAGPERLALETLGHEFSEVPEIGAATGVERLPDGRWLAAAERTRRGGGSAAVVEPRAKADGLAHATPVAAAVSVSP